MLLLLLLGVVMMQMIYQPIIDSATTDLLQRKR